MVNGLSLPALAPCGDRGSIRSVSQCRRHGFLLPGAHPVPANMVEVRADILEDTGALVMLALFVVEAARQR